MSDVVSANQVYRSDRPLSRSVPCLGPIRPALRLSVAGRAGPDGVGVTLVSPSGVTTEFGSEFRQQGNEAALDDASSLDASDVAETIAYATDQEVSATVTELDLNRRDIYQRF